MDIRETKKEDATQTNKPVTELSTFYLHAEKDSLPDWLSSSLTIIEFENRINSNEFTNLVFENNGNIIGYISIKNTHHIYHLFVSQEHQRKGIAKKLWNNARMLCPSKTYAVRSSLHAIPVYESFGFSKHSSIEIIDNIKQWN